MAATDTGQQARIDALRAQLTALGCEQPTLDSIPADMEEEFLTHVLEYETAVPTSLFQLLANTTGAELPAPDSLDDAGLSIILMKTARDLAKLGAYLIHTDHLSDRQLYEYLYNDGLREEAVLFPENPAYAYIIDLTGSGSDEDNQTYLRYYATDQYRQEWSHDWPDDPVPDRQKPPFNRDRFLPQSLIS